MANLLHRSDHLKPSQWYRHGLVDSTIALIGLRYYSNRIVNLGLYTNRAVITNEPGKYGTAWEQTNTPVAVHAASSGLLCMPTSVPVLKVVNVVGPRSSATKLATISMYPPPARASFSILAETPKPVVAIDRHSIIDGLAVIAVCCRCGSLKVGPPKCKTHSPGRWPGSQQMPSSKSVQCNCPLFSPSAGPGGIP